MGPLFQVVKNILFVRVHLRQDAQSANDSPINTALVSLLPGLTLSPWDASKPQNHCPLWRLAGMNRFNSAGNELFVGLASNGKYFIAVGLMGQSNLML